jgi:nucleoside-diphosphate-sugar epimerase
MPAIEQGSLVLVTGASGFIGASSPFQCTSIANSEFHYLSPSGTASHLCSTLLINGYKVRGTVRSADKGEYLKRLFEGVGEFEYVIVEDIADVRVPSLPPYSFPSLSRKSNADG